MNGKYSQTLIDQAKQAARHAVKTLSKRAIQKTAEITGGSIGNKFSNRIKKLSINLPQNNSETVTNKHEKEIPKERYIFPKKDAKLLVN